MSERETEVLAVVERETEREAVKLAASERDAVVLLLTEGDWLASAAALSNGHARIWIDFCL